ncbi:MAG: ATP-binding protein, partial [Verrucomicrobia bacterium]|nr:ATP-binding protein [Verrucomicrobiota bacterium]
GQPLQGVLCLKADADDTIWMGTHDAGLMRWRRDKIDRIGVDNGLPDQELRGIIEDNLGYFWISSSRGIIRASRNQLHAVADGAVSRLDCQILDHNDGLPSAECSTGQPTCARDAAGRIWFATQKGVAGIDPASFRLNSRPPPVHVEQLTYRVPATRPRQTERRLSGTSDHGELRLTAPFPQPLRLPPGSYGLELEYAALSFSAPEKARFQFMLEGHSSDWEDVQNRGIVRFYQLQPGDYIFRVRAANNDGVWNETGASLAFTVLPFFWQTGWFRLGAGLLLVALGGALVWSRVHRRIALALERERLAHEMQELREELAHSSRVSTMGHLASALAHELSQPLGAILSNAEAAELLIEQDPPDLAEIRTVLTDIRRDDERARGVIDRIRTMLKRRKVEHTQLNLGELLHEVAALVSADALRREVQLTIAVLPDLPPVRGDRVQLQQVLLNLLLNAMDAMSEQPPETRRLLVQARSIENQKVEVSVRDSGPGITVQELPSVFEPFFSTKPHGMGLGLPISRNIIEAHSGRLWAENNLGGGASFYFTLPVANG